MMDPLLKYHDIFLKRYQVPRQRTPSHADQVENHLKPSEHRIHDGNDTKYSNRFVAVASPARRNYKISTRNNSPGITEPTKPVGKDHRSNSTDTRKRTYRPLSNQIASDKPFGMDIHAIETKHPELLQKIQIYMKSDMKAVSTRRETPQRTPSSRGGHRRFNSQAVTSQSRAISNERPSNLHSKNNSLLNNTSMIEEHLNNSKESNYMKDPHEISQLFSAHQSSHTRIENTTHENNDIILQELDGNTIKAPEEKHACIEKGKILFREKNYGEALKYLREGIAYEPNSLELRYLLGVCFLWKGQHENAIKELNNLLEKQAFYHKNVFILLSIAYKKCGNIAAGIKVLTRAITKFSKYYDAYILRGKLFLKDKKWEKALSDFKFATEVNPQRAMGYIGKGDCLRMLGDFDEAVNCYTEAMSKEPNSLTVALLKRAIAYIELKHFEDAMIDLATLISKDPTNSEAHYFRGFILEKKSKQYVPSLKTLEDINEAILCFEQAIKHNTSKKAVVKSLYDITRIKIEQRAFYEAYHTLHRADLLNVDEKIFSRFKLFTEGVIQLMKRKFDEGVDNLSNILKNKSTDFLKNLAYSYRAYGLFCAGKVRKALQDYHEVQKQGRLDRAASFNKLLCEGIIAAEEANYDAAMANFDKAQKLYKNKMEPFFYKGCLQIYQFIKTYSKKDTKKLHLCLNSALKEIDKAVELNDNNANLHYIRALILYGLEKLDQANAAIEKAIEKADENYPKYYFLRGCILASSQAYQRAIGDCSIALNLDKDFSPAYLERGKCYFSLGDVKQAFMDIQKYIAVRPEDSNIHYWAGNLLFNTGAYEDAVRAYSNYDNINKNEELLVLRTKCNIILKELNAALGDLNKLVDLKTQNNVKYHIDKECLQSLKIATGFSKDDGESENSCLIQGIQKLAKTLSYKNSGEIFQIHDLYFYKSVFHFYLGEYEQALQELETCWAHHEKYVQRNIEKRRNSIEVDSQEMIKILEEFCQDKDEEDESKNIKGAIDVREYLYNKAIYYLALRKWDEASECLDQIIPLMPNDLTAKIEEFQSLITEEKMAKELGDDRQGEPQKQPEKSIEIVIFPCYNRLCSIFPSCKIPFSKKPGFETRLSFCLPNLDPPNMTPTINADLLDEITVTSVEYRPEAPWIKRNLGGVVFTENFIDKEEKEIENLNEVIKINNLNPEEIYESIEKTKKTAEDDEVDEENADDSKRETLDNAMIVENESNVQRIKATPEDSVDILDEEILGKNKLRRAKTGAL